MQCINCDKPAVWLFKASGVATRGYCNPHLPAAYRSTKNVTPYFKPEPEPDPDPRADLDEIIHPDLDPEPEPEPVPKPRKPRAEKVKKVETGPDGETLGLPDPSQGELDETVPVVPVEDVPTA